MTLENALEEIKHWSETFYEPIKIMPEKLQAAVVSLYLCLRSVDEIEDSHLLTKNEKESLLWGVSRSLQSGDKEVIKARLGTFFKGFEDRLEKVTLDFGHWIDLAPDEIAARIFDGTSAMASRMIHWVRIDWKIVDLNDLDEYFYAVAATPGLVLSDIWAWFEGKKTNRVEAVGFGNYMQALNIMRGRVQDMERGVDFFPENSTMNEIVEYALKQKEYATNYTNSLQSGFAYNACVRLLEIADKTLDKFSKNIPVEFDGKFKP